jgi:undecaprenyl-diphosphatase
VRAALSTAAVCLLLSFVLALAVSGDDNSLVQFDGDAARYFHGHSSAALRDFFDTVTWFGSPGLWIAGAGASAFLIVRRWWADLLTGAVMIGAGKLFNLWLKGMFARERPLGSIVVGGHESYSFPSGHAMMALLLYGFLAILLWRAYSARRARARIGMGTIMLVTLIGISRIYLGVHYPSDVLGGYVMGGTWLCLCLAGRYALSERVRGEHPAPTTTTS